MAIGVKARLVPCLINWRNPDGDDTCHGGGFWRIDNQRGCIILYGRSFDFGAPEFMYLRRIDTSTVPGSLGYPMFYEREFAGEEIMEPVVCIN